MFLLSNNAFKWNLILALLTVRHVIHMAITWDFTLAQNTQQPTNCLHFITLHCERFSKLRCYFSVDCIQCQKGRFFIK